MAKKLNRPSWFKVFLNQKAFLDATPDEAVGRAFKAAMQYFATGELPHVDPAAAPAFAGFKEHIDECFADFQEASEKNRRNVANRWGGNATSGNKTIPADTSGIPRSERVRPDTTDTEAEAEADAEGDNNVYKGNKVENGCAENQPIQLQSPPPATPDQYREARERVYRAMIANGMSPEEAARQTGWRGEESEVNADAV